MWKAIVAGTAALAIAGTSLVYAQQRGGRDGMMQGWQPNTEDLRAFGEARLAALKAGLVLTPEQEKALLEFVESGKGFIPLHCASYCFLNSPKYVEMVGAQLAGSDRFKYQLWDLLMLERWHQMFIDEPPVPRASLLGGVHAY